MNKCEQQTKIDINKYMALIEAVVKTEMKKFNISYIIEYPELINLSIQVIHALDKNGGIERYNKSYISTAIKWAIRNEARRRSKWYSQKSKNDISEDGKNEIREAVYKTILSVDEMADAEKPTLIKDTKRNPAEVVEFHELGHILKNAIKSLPQREKELIEAKFFKEKKLREISIEFNISQSRVSRIIQSALNRLKKELKKQNFA